MTERFIMILLLIALGYILKRIGYVKGSEAKVMTTIVLNVTLPAVVIVNLNGATLTPSLSLLPILMILYGIITKLIVIILFIKYNNEVRGTVAMLMASLNIGIFAYPLVEQMWPKYGLLYFGMADIGGAILMFGVTYIIAGYFKNAESTLNIKTIVLKCLSSIPLMTYSVMISLCLLTIEFPPIIIDFFDLLGKANLPLSMMLLGVLLDFKIERRYLPLTFKYVGIHYGLGLLFGSLVYFFLPVSDDMIKTTLILIWLLPVGVATLSYAVQFQYRTLPMIAMASNMTVVISIGILYMYQHFFLAVP
ncbi:MULTISPECIES: AEC family transporter [Staphylococcus]|uniref:AEC family transporter n=1 Tax=Staphylococcus agnetis TaxID=985762 RepID=A0A2T4MHT4_9STAP|nr:AEC family transporter [Staphylococcus agnetis]NHM91887.1 AEC family transporter [Staphylococcus sp. 10602379]ALN77103.1 AEC family transporter [Staphylococcus agnetis]MDG4943285.1 AEC family transporter [Staphylococcus agnetis]NJI02565.1 AEC family transporter [Staphylococcus agnetis]NJI12398.1 AEC family transporter [Staphylococcus agnetis]